MAIPLWSDIYPEILTGIHAALPSVSISAGTGNAVWSSFQAVTQNIVENAKLDGSGIAGLPFVFVEGGEYQPDPEWGVAQLYYRAPLRIYYVDSNVNQDAVFTALNALRTYFDSPTRQFSHFQVIEVGAVHSSGSNEVMASLASQLRTTLRGGYVSWDPGWLVGE